MENNTESLVRQNYAQEVEAGVNKLINMYMHISYVYLSMANYFQRPDIELPNVSGHFKKAADCKRDSAIMLMEYQNRRGGQVVLQDVQKPERDEWDGALEAFQASLALEKLANRAMLELHKSGEQTEDRQFCEWMEEKYLRPAVECIEKLGCIITNLRRVGKGLGEFLFDKHFA